MITFLYVGPGIGLGTIVIIGIILLIIALSFGVVIWRQAKRFFKKLKKRD